MKERDTAIALVSQPKMFVASKKKTHSIYAWSTLPIDQQTSLNLAYSSLVCYIHVSHAYVIGFRFVLFLHIFTSFYIQKHLV